MNNKHDISVLNGLGTTILEKAGHDQTSALKHSLV